MSRYIVFKKDLVVDPKKLRFQRVKNLWDVRYQDDENPRGKHIYFQTPPLRLSLIEEDNYNYYMIFKLSEKDQQFWDMIATVDMATVEEMCQDPTEWNFREDTPTSIIESHYVPSLRMSSVNYEHSFYLTVPKTDDVSIFDQNEVQVDLSTMKPGYKITLLLLLDGVESRNHYYHLKFILEQAKVRIPLERKIIADDEETATTLPTGQCLLNDSEGDMVSNYPGNESKNSRRPKAELYGYSDNEFDEDDPNQKSLSRSRSKSPALKNNETEIDLHEETKESDLVEDVAEEVEVVANKEEAVENKEEGVEADKEELEVKQDEVKKEEKKEEVKEEEFEEVKKEEPEEVKKEEVKKEEKKLDVDEKSVKEKSSKERVRDVDEKSVREKSSKERVREVDEKSLREKSSKERVGDVDEKSLREKSSKERVRDDEKSLREKSSKERVRDVDEKSVRRDRSRSQNRSRRS